MSPVEQELLTLPEHLSSSWVLRGIHVTRSLVVCVCFVDSCMSILFGSLYCLDFLRYTDYDYPFGSFKLFLGGLLLFMLSNYMSPVFRSVHRCPRKNDVRFVFTPICVVGFFCFMLFVFMYVHCM